MTYLFTEPLNESVSMEFDWKSNENPDKSDNGRVGLPSKGRYPMMMDDPTTGERVYYWLDFKTASDGKKSAIISTKTDAIDTLFFSDDQSWYQEYVDYMNGASEPEETEQTELTVGEYTIAGFRRKDEATLILDFSSAEGVKFSLMGSPEEACADGHYLEGVMQANGDKKYIYKTDGCTIHFEIEAKQVTIREEKCARPPKGCSSWNGVYLIDM